MFWRATADPDIIGPVSPHGVFRERTVLMGSLWKTASPVLPSTTDLGSPSQVGQVGMRPEPRAPPLW